VATTIGALIGAALATIIPTHVLAILLGIVLLGVVGLLAELALIEHTEDTAQWIPLVLLVLGLAATLAALLRPARATVRALQAVGVLWIAAGALGIWLHLDGNLEFEREDDPAAGGGTLLLRAATGATPILAPGALAQLGLIALCVGYGHPALRRGARAAGGTHTSDKERS